jgi:hypothetical protein
MSVAIDVPGEEPYHYQPRLFSKVVNLALSFPLQTTLILVGLTLPFSLLCYSIQSLDIQP